jgi:hypothetical protein
MIEAQFIFGGGAMRRIGKLGWVLLLTLILTAAQPAYAGDGATIVLKSGAIVFIPNGYSQIVAGMKGLKLKGSENYPVELNIEGNTFFINLGEVAVLCRDRCESLTIINPKKEER